MGGGENTFAEGTPSLKHRVQCLQCAAVLEFEETNSEIFPEDLFPKGFQ